MKMRLDWYINLSGVFCTCVSVNAHLIAKDMFLLKGSVVTG